MGACNGAGGFGTSWEGTGELLYIRCPEIIRRSRDRVRDAAEGLGFGSGSQADKRKAEISLGQWRAISPGAINGLRLHLAGFLL